MPSLILVVLTLNLPILFNVLLFAFICLLTSHILTSTVQMTYDLVLALINVLLLPLIQWTSH